MTIFLINGFNALWCLLFAFDVKGEYIILKYDCEKLRD